MALSPALADAAAFLSSSSAPSLAKVSNTTKLELYGLYKYLAVASAPQSPRPSLFDLTGRAKWDAWSNAGKRYANDRAKAETRYLAVARELGWVPGSGVASERREEGEVWDEDLGVSVSPSSAAAGRGGGMGGSVSAMAAPGSDDAGGHALHSFAIRGDVDGVTRCFAEDPLADVDQRDEYGYTALHLACDRGNLRVVQALLKHGADATAKDPDDLTGIELAQIAGHDDICALLQTGLYS